MNIGSTFGSDDIQDNVRKLSSWLRRFINETILAISLSYIKCNCVGDVGTSQCSFLQFRVAQLQNCIILGLPQYTINWTAQYK